MKCVICHCKLSKKDVIMRYSKPYCKRCFNRIPDVIEIVPINPLHTDKESKPLM